MNEIYKGRYTASTDEPFVVFLIGMRINRFWAFNKWVPTAIAMGPMLRTLYTHPEKGFLGGETFFNGRTIASIQYWRSFEDLERFARQPSDPHLAAWKRFNQSVGADGSVGIWHETFLVQPGSMRACMATCLPLAWRRPPGMYPLRAGARPPAAAWAARTSRRCPHQSPRW